jgi:hypothetical protein
VAPESCVKFARGLWDHQIQDQTTGNFSRHADYWTHRPGKNREFPRHGGFYIATWAMAYQHTKGPVFLKAIETLLDYFDRRRSPESDALPCQSDVFARTAQGKGKDVWPPSNLSLAVDLWDSADVVPNDLAEKMRRSASRTDAVFLAIDHDLSRQGKGFVNDCNVDTLKVLEYSKGIWGAGYGAGGDACIANLCMLRYRQVGLDGYRQLVLRTGDRYVATEPDRKGVLHPGPLGDAIYLMLSCYELSGDTKYFKEAHRFARLAIDIFLNDGSPLPPATTQHRHYEAITRGDTLMMALLQLSLVQKPPPSPVTLTYTDR